MKPKIVVIGSSNTDMVIKTKHSPLPGETILGGNFFMSAGGKGANQAVAAARLGGDVVFIAKVGNDVFGQQAKDGFANENINTDYVFIDETKPSGVALITVDENGENCIVVASGANASLSINDIDKASDAIQDADVVLAQLEIPIKSVEKVIELAFNKGKKVVLNPAPALPLPDFIYKQLFLITPNEKEASMLSGIAVSDENSATVAAKYFIRKGVRHVIITLGSKGALLCSENNFTLIPSPSVYAIDTTAAGDVFNGALVVALAQGNEMCEAVRFANSAAALSVTKLGAQASAPFRNEVNVFMQQQS